MHSPNILFLMTDQHRADVAGWAGNPVIRTPHLDGLARTGVIFRNCYTPAPVCVPARQCLLSGQYPWTCGCEGWDALPPGHLTFPRLFSRHGYETVLCGNMHLLGPDQMAGFTIRIGENCWLYKKYRDLLPAAAARADRGEPGTGKWPMAKEIMRASAGRGRGDQRDRYALQGALDFVEQYFIDPWYDQPGSHQPLLLGLSLVQPHYPFLADEERFAYYLNRVQPFVEDREPSHPCFAHQRVRPGIDVTARDIRRATAAYYAMVERTDAYFGQLVAALERADQNLDDWIVVYCADHGEMLGQYGLWEKMVFYEGSARVPFFIRWPRGFAGGRELDANVSLCDLFATLADLAGLPVPAGLDSRSMASCLRGNGDIPNGEVFSQYQGNQLMIKQGTLKYIRFAADDAEFLFDLATDPAEIINRIADPALAPQVAQFRCRLAGLRPAPAVTRGWP